MSPKISATVAIPSSLSFPLHLSLPLYLYIHSPSPNAMDSIIETQRQTHEGIERYEQALAEVLMQNPTAVSTPAQHKNPSRANVSAIIDQKRG